MCGYISIYLCLCLSLSIYIYICTHTYNTYRVRKIYIEVLPNWIIRINLNKEGLNQTMFY